MWIVAATIHSEVLSISAVDRIIFMEGGLGKAFHGKFLYMSTKMRPRKERNSQFEVQQTLHKGKFQTKKKGIKSGNGCFSCTT